MTQGFNDNLYLIDLSYLNTPAEIVYDLSTILDTPPAQNQRVRLNLGKVDFNKSQLLSIKSLIESINSTLSIVEGESEITRNSAISIGLVYQNITDMVPDVSFDREAQQQPVFTQVEPELFPNVSPTNERVEEQQEVSQENSENKEEYVAPEESGETFNIEPQKFEVSEESLNFEENNKDWIETPQNSPVQSFAGENEEINFSNSQNENNNNSEHNPTEQRLDNLFEGRQNEMDMQDMTIEEAEKKHQEEMTSDEGEKQSLEEAVGIQSLADIPLDIPSDTTIQNELDVIYSAERKLEDVFATTGLREEKFQSLKDAPKAEEKEYTQYDFELEAFPTKYLKQTICAGQYISFDGNLVIIGDCHEGSEISASGDITVWGELSGCAHAGKNGNEKCKIRALKMNASQLRIANCYVKRPSVLNGDASKVEAVPEEAMILKGEIAVYKIYK